MLLSEKENTEVLNVVRRKIYVLAANVLVTRLLIQMMGITTCHYDVVFVNRNGHYFIKWTTLMFQMNNSRDVYACSVHLYWWKRQVSHQT